MESEKKTSGGATASGGGAVALENQGGRKRFFIELKPGETTIVSWKKLVGDDPEFTTNSAPPSPPSPPAKSEYTQEEKSRSKNSSAFVNGEKKKHNKGSPKLANSQPKKRRNDVPEDLEEDDDVHLPTKHAKMGHVRGKVSSKNAPFVGKHSIQSQVLTASGENCYDDKLQHQLNASVAPSTTKLSDLGIKLGSSPYAKASDEDVLGSLEDARNNDKIGVTTCPRDHGNDVNVLNDNPDVAYERHDDTACSESQSRTLVSDINEEEHSVNISHKDNGKIELPDLNLPYTAQAAKTAPTHISDSSGGTVRGTMLERAIVELETMVAELRPLHIDVQDADHLQAIKRRLPRELKQTLAKVARLAKSSQGKISDELINHLMIILGHWVQLRTLKRYLREMIPEGLSAIREEDDRFRQIELEVIEMIKLQSPSLEAKAGTSNDIVDLPASKVVHEGRHSMDYKMEDKVCDLYDIYVQGMDEVKSPEIRKFYIQLAGLWPEGAMDNHGIRDAICRAKERRRKLFQEKGLEKCKRKKSSTPRTDEIIHEETSSVDHAQGVPKRQANDTITLVLTSTDSFISSTPNLDQNLNAPAKRLCPPSTGSCKDLLKQGKFEFPEDSSVKQIELSVEHLEIGSKAKSLSLKQEKDCNKPLKHEVEHYHK